MYPTKEKILKKLPIIKKETIKEVLLWKQVWKKIRKEKQQVKFVCIGTLLFTLSEIYNKPLKNILLTKNASAYYDPQQKIIYLTNPQSIISALHEFSHHVYGNSELQACRWSIAIFKQVFPKAYEKLDWQGHMLIKKRL